MKKDTALRRDPKPAAPGLVNPSITERMTIPILLAVSFLFLLLAAPLLGWLRIPQPEALQDALKLKASAVAAMRPDYGPLTLLSFVQHAKLGILGLPAMLLLALTIAAMWFHLAAVIRILKGRKERTELSRAFGMARTASFFSLLLAAAVPVFIGFANYRLGVQGLSATPVPYLSGLLSLAGFMTARVAVVRERRLQGERGFLYELKTNWILFVMLIPAFGYFLINNYLPMVGVYFAFTSFNFRDGLWASPFIGLKNFQHLFRADLFRLTQNTILYNLVFIGVGNVLQVAFAIFVSQIARTWFKRVSQTMMFMPYFVSFVILKVLVFNLFEYQSGLVNAMLVLAGGERIDFYNAPGWWPMLITVFYLWKNIGYGMVIYLATIMGISQDYYDSAKIDGAGIFQQIRYITLPLIQPTFIILLLYALGSIMKGQFELFYQIIGNNGVLYNVTDIFDTFVYRITTTQPLNIGIGTAAGLYQSLFGFIVILATNYMVKRKSPENALF